MYMIYACYGYIYIYTRWEYERCTPGLPEMSSSLSLSLWLGGHLGHFPRFNDVGKCVKCKSKYSIRGAFSICEREGREQVYPPVFGPPIPSKYSH